MSTSFCEGDLRLRLGRLVERERAVCDVAGAFVFSDHYSGAGRLALDEHQAGRDRAVGKKALASPEQDGKYHHLKLVDEIVLHKRLDQIAATVHLDLRPGLFLESRDLLPDVTFDEGGVLPLNAVQRARGDVLLRVVQAIRGWIVFDVGPMGSEYLVRL